MNEARLFWHLANWAEWQRDDARACARGFPRHVAIIGGTGSRDFDSMCKEADSRCALAVDAILDGLPPPDRCAVHAQHLGARWRFPGELGDHYTHALGTIRRGLIRRGIV